MSHREFVVEAVWDRLTSALEDGLEGAVLPVSLLDALRDPATCLAMEEELDGDEGPAGVLSRVVLVFCLGIHMARENAEDWGALEEGLEALELHYRGFAYEGAAAAFAMLDYEEPAQTPRLTGWLAGPGRRHAALSAIGAGKNTVFRRRYDAIKAACSPELWPLAVDGFGFREAFLYRRRTLVQHHVPLWLPEHDRSAFDRGVGRGLWFTLGADTTRTRARIETFPASRQADLWRGVGFAAVYTGAADPDDTDALRGVPHREALLAGAALGAEARVLGGCITPRTVRATRALCGLAPDVLASGPLPLDPR